jgi:glycosyltransferase involved in cell wall biosynthesis
VRAEVIDRYRVAADRVTAVPLAVDERFRRPPSTERQHATQERLGLQPPYVVALGGAARRNLPRAMAAWREVRRSHPDLALVVVGSQRPPPEPGLFIAGAADDDGWRALLASAAAFVYPTEYEGFGMPALEALASGTIVVCGRVGALPEVLGDAAAWCESVSIEGVAARVRDVLDNEQQAARLRELGRLRIDKGPTWSAIATEMLRGYHEAFDG